MSVPSIGHSATGAVERTKRPTSRSRLRRDARGQSLVEFSVVLPILLAIVGVVIDASRLYQGWTNLESATRDAAQYLARSSVDPLSDDFTLEGADSDAKAIYILNQATGTTFERSDVQGTLTDCDEPQLTTTYTTDTSASIGGSTAYPLGTATVLVCMPFRTLFQYPFISDGGTWTLGSERQMTLIVGR